MDTRTTPAFPLTARAEVLALRNSKIREVANAGIGLPDVLPFWFGEPDEVTPKFIRDAGIASIERGDTFYTQNFGIPELRDAGIENRGYNIGHVGADAGCAGPRRPG